MSDAARTTDQHLAWLEEVRRFLAASPADRGFAEHWTRWTVCLRNYAAEVLADLDRRRAHAPDELRAVLGLPSTFAIGPYRFSADFFTPHAPAWIEMLGPLLERDDNRILEIGSLEGNSACWIADHLLRGPRASLTCVDLIAPSARALLHRNLEATGKRDRITLIEGRSQDVLPSLTSGSFDLIYVDGSHREPDVRVDAAEAWRLARDGATIVFDDYGLAEIDAARGLEWYPVRAAVDEFMAAHAGRFELLRSGYQLALAKCDPR